MRGLIVIAAVVLGTTGSIGTTHAASAWVQQNVTTPASGPLVYDTKHHGALMFNGTQTWLWSTAAATWTQQLPAHEPVLLGGDYELAFDSNRGVAVLTASPFTNIPGPTDILSTWEWDGADWTQKQPAHSPPPRFDHSSNLTFDSGRSVTVLVSGQFNNDTSPGDTWEWNGTDWTQNMAAGGTTKRFGHCMTYDSDRHQVVLRGGQENHGSGGGTWFDTWEYDGTSWVHTPDPNSSPFFLLNGCSITYDHAIARTIDLTNNSAGSIITFYWDGRTWTRVGPDGPVIGGRAVYDPDNHVVVLVGGGTWLLNPLPAPPPPPPPPPSPAPALTVYQSPGERMVAITPGPDGNIWYTRTPIVGSVFFNSFIGRVTPTGAITEFPTAYGNLYGITRGSDGNVWFTDNSNDTLGQITPAGAITHFGGFAPSGNSNANNPYGITNGPDGNLWFTEEFSGPALQGRIGQMTPTGSLTEFALPSTDGNNFLENITAGPDGNLWFTAAIGNFIGRITPAGVITEFPVPTGHAGAVFTSAPYGITSGPDGNVWFTENSAQKVGRITPNGVITEFPVKTCGLSGIAAGSDGNLWFTDPCTRTVGAITVSGVATMFTPFPGLDALDQITLGADGRLWATDNYVKPDGTHVGAIAVFASVVPPPPTVGLPVITSLSPNQGPYSGGTTVTITGANFTGASFVSFRVTTRGLNPCSPTNVPYCFTVNSDTQITAVSPPDVAGAYDVYVVTPKGFTVNSPADVFTYTVPLIYVAVGDSYSSGEGAPPFEDGFNYPAVTGVQENTYTYGPTGPSNWCHRSLTNYAKLSAPSLDLNRAVLLVDRTCSGAQIVPAPGGAPIVTTPATLNRPETSQVQQAIDRLSAAGLGPNNVDVVTATMGGNDAGFGDIISACLIPNILHVLFQSPLAVPGELQFIGNQLGTCKTLDATVFKTDPKFSNLVNLEAPAQSNLTTTFPNARVFQLTYPLFVPPAGTFPGDSCGGVLAQDTAYARDKGHQLDKIIRDQGARTRATNSNFHIVDLQDMFGANPLCPVVGQPLINGVSQASLNNLIGSLVTAGTTSRALFDNANNAYVNLRNCLLFSLPPGNVLACALPVVYLASAITNLKDYFAANSSALISQLEPLTPVSSPNPTFTGTDAQKLFDSSRLLFHPNQAGWNVMSCALVAAIHNSSNASCQPPAGAAPQYVFNGAVLTSTAPLAVTPGTPISYQFNGFGPSSSVSISAWSAPTDLGTVTADASGSIAGTLTLPLTLNPGVHRIEFRGTNNGSSRNIDVLVRIAGLPRAGEDYGLYFSGFGGDSSVDVSYGGLSWGSFTPDASGGFFIELTVPAASGPGSLAVVATGSTTQTTSTQTIPLDTDLRLAGVPGNITVNATSQSGAVVAYAPRAVDEAADGGTGAVSCNPASGSTFAIGTTTVTCTATDADDANSPVTASFVVTVNDTDLRLVVPANITANATSPSGAVVTYGPPTALDEAADGATPTASCTPASGTTFPIGTTTVTCTTTDADDTPTTESAQFTVTVLVDLRLHVSVNPGIATTGTVVSANISLTNAASVSRTVTLVATFSYVSPSGQKLTMTTSNITITLSPGQTIARSFKFQVSRLVPRGTYMFSITGSDTTGSITSTATFTVT